jgi:phosphonoacetate hydrolase
MSRLIATRRGGVNGPSHGVALGGRESGYTGRMRPVVLVCLDGMGPDYVAKALEAGLWPRIREWERTGFLGTALGILPSFTNPNNLSLTTGLPSAGHGICGNHFFDRGLGREVALEDPTYLCAPTWLAVLEAQGARVGAVCAKHKLRRLLGAGRSGLSLSAERATQGFPGWGIERLDAFVERPVPPVYSAEASTFVLAAGVALLKRVHPDFLYLSTTDYLQHLHAPGALELAPFLREVDRLVGALVDLGAVVALTADHGMSAKPNVVFLGDLLPEARVTLPITDPYVRHHGALGGCAFVDVEDPERARATLLATPGIEEVLGREAAARRHEMPADRLGDLVVFACADTALGKTPRDHDLGALAAPLRSHGGPAEREVPILLSERPAAVPRESRALLPVALELGGWPRMKAPEPFGPRGPGRG